MIPARIALALCLLFAVGCEKPAPDAGSRTFRAPRPAQPPPSAVPEKVDAQEAPAPAEDSGPPDEIIEAVLSVLEGIRGGKRGDEARTALAKELAQAMRENSYCQPDRRVRVAGEIVGNVVDADVKRPLSGIPDEQMWRLADGLARDLAVRCGDDIPRGGTVTALPKLRAPKGHVALSWLALKGFTFKSGTPLPAAVTALSGQKAAINGYMIPLSTEQKPREFVLVGSLWDCCFGKPPAINHGIIVTFPDGAAYTDFPILVTGTFEVGEELEDGEVTSVFRLRATSVVPQSI